MSVLDMLILIFSSPHPFLNYTQSSRNSSPYPLSPPLSHPLSLLLSPPPFPLSLPTLLSSLQNLHMSMNMTEIVRQLNKLHRANISPCSSQSSLSQESSKCNQTQGTLGHPSSPTHKTPHTPCTICTPQGIILASSFSSSSITQHRRRLWPLLKLHSQKCTLPCWCVDRH